MKSRRHEELATQSPIKTRVRDRPIELDLANTYPHGRWSLSPHGMEASCSRRNSSLERREYRWEFGDGRGDRIRSRSQSPPISQMQKRPHYDEVGSSREYLKSLSASKQPRDEILRKPDAPTGYRYYAHDDSATIREADRLPDSDQRRRTLSHNLMVMEDGIDRGMHRSPAEMRAPSRYLETGAIITSISSNVDLARFRDERIQYPDPLLLDKLSAMEYSIEGNPLSYSRDIPYITLPTSRSKGSQFEDLPTSSVPSRAHLPGSYQGGIPFPRNKYLRTSEKLNQPLAVGGYGQRHVLDTAIHTEAYYKDLTLYERDMSSPGRVEHQDYPYLRHPVRKSNDYGYSSDELHRRIALHERVGNDRSNLFATSKIDPVAMRLNDIVHSHRNVSDSSLRDHHSLQDQVVSDYIHMSRLSAPSYQDREYLDGEIGHIMLERRIPRPLEIPYVDALRNREISPMRSAYGFRRVESPVFHDVIRSSEVLSEAELQRLPARVPEMKMEHGTCSPSDRIPKRKYSMDQETDRLASRNIMSSRWNSSYRTRDINDRSEDWMDKDGRGSFMSKIMDHNYDSDLYGRGRKKFDRSNHRRVSLSDNWLSSHDPAEDVQEYYTKPCKINEKHLKGHLKTVPHAWNKSSHSSKGNFWTRSVDDNQVEMQGNDIKESDEWETSANSEPPEDSEEFKKLVHEFFLGFTKKLNENPFVRKRYTEQGRAGSLFCIVCGRSQSKEFMDTQRLVQHTLMSHKVGLKAQHLGLHKAISVLMGWNSVVALDAVPKFPEPVSIGEALSQKEDLILWPPVVVIHNSSMSDNDLKGKITNIEALGEFLRGKGFSVGKMKICHGKPAKYGIMIVKSLGTFSGLQDAEKLHKYFVDNKRGRTEFEKLVTSKGKSSHRGEIGMQGDKVEELALYGYMGIAEDLDKVDSDTKWKCSIKSKKEIKDLVDAPIKHEWSH